jgi:transcriptional regulator with XRE-family HTH domain
MPGRERLLSLGSRRGDRLVAEIGESARELRLGLGLSRRELAASLGVSASKLGRWERGLRPYPDLWDAARLFRLLGNDLSWKCFPAGRALRDAGHAALISAFLRVVPANIPRWLELPIPRPGDLRAWDVVLELCDGRIGVVAETRLRDWQALLRREELKARDSGIERILLVLLNSNTNREAVRDAGATLRSALPLDGRTILPALRAGRNPGGNGLLFLSAASRIRHQVAVTTKKPA